MGILRNKNFLGCSSFVFCYQFCILLSADFYSQKIYYKAWQTKGIISQNKKYQKTTNGFLRILPKRAETSEGDNLTLGVKKETMQIQYFCNEKEPTGALILTGEWGCGKTHLIEHDLKDALKDSHIIAFAATRWIHINTITYLSWLVMAIEVVFVVSICIVVGNSVIYKDRMLRCLTTGKRMIKRRITREKG